MARKKNTAKKKDEAKGTTTLEVVESKKTKGAEEKAQAKGGTKSTETPTAPKDTVSKESEKGKAPESKPTKLTRIESTVQAFFAMSGKSEVNKKTLAREANLLYAESGGADNEKEALWASGYMLAFQDALRKYNHTLG